jgi:hypothetical protein
MFRLTRTLALTAFALMGTAAGPAVGGPPVKKPAPPPPPHARHGGPQPVVFKQVNTSPYVANYHLHHGVKFDHGYFYRGFEHRHWSHIYFHPVHNVRVYFDPFTRFEYYWCPWDNCFYPLAYRPYGRYVFP